MTDVNDEYPRFLQNIYSLTVSEKASPGDPIGAVTAIDEDLGDGGIVEYFILPSWSSDLFSIDQQSGLIQLRRQVDFEEVCIILMASIFICFSFCGLTYTLTYTLQVQLYILTVEARDKADSSHRTNVTVYINVLDENDNAPSFPDDIYSASVFENVTLFTPIATVTANDIDTGTWSNFLTQY